VGAQEVCKKMYATPPMEYRVYCTVNNKLSRLQFFLFKFLRKTNKLKKAAVFHYLNAVCGILDTDKLMEEKLSRLELELNMKVSRTGTRAQHEGESDWN
jgi:hypothetical protein